MSGRLPSSSVFWRRIVGHETTLLSASDAVSVSNRHGMTRLMTRFLIVSAVFSFGLAACSMRDGMTDACEWPFEAGAALDVRNSAHERHLMEDVRVAEELGIRYNDARLARGLAVPGKPQTRDECDTKLFSEIAHIHAVSLADVRQARLNLNRAWDPTIYLPLAALYVVVAFALARRIRRRFSWSDEKSAAIVATFFVSLVMATALMPLGHLWSGVVEMIRVGDMHMSYRTDRLGWRGYDLEAFAVGIFVYWSIALTEFTIANSNLTPERTAER